MITLDMRRDRRTLGCVPLLIGCLALAFPRVALAAVWLFGDNYLERAFGSWIWPVLGFVFLPLTTLTFAFATNALERHGTMPPLGWLLTAIALAVDIGLLGSGRSQYRSRRDSEY